MAALKLTISTQEQHPPKPPPPTKKKGIIRAGHFFGPGLNKEKKNALKRPIILKEPPHYVCMHACMLACMYVCMYACMHACMYVCMYVRT